MHVYSAGCIKKGKTISACNHRRPKIESVGGGAYSYIRVLHCSFLLKSIVFKVCEHEYMNMPPPPLIDLSTPTCYRAL